ncbi:MAG: HlyD family type I secretion periplasmic adaptor subunit [Pseudomonadota bacterium]
MTGKDIDTATLSNDQALSNGQAFLDRMPGIKLPETPPTRVRTLVFWLVFVCFGLFGSLAVWAAYAPLKSAVIAAGFFQVEGDRLVLQHPEGGIVTEISVKEGDLVQEGQVIAVLDPTEIRASVGILEAQLAGALAQQARLTAELREDDDLELSQELADMIQRSPELAELFNTQRELFRSNRSTIEGQLLLFDSRIQQVTEQLEGMDSRYDAFNERLKIVEAELVSLNGLFEKGLTTQIRLNERLEDQNNIIGEIGALDSDRQNALERISETQERKLQLRRDWLRQIAQNQDTTFARVIDLRERLLAGRAALERMVIKAPQAGRVVELQINTVGGVIGRGQRILEIVPSDANLILETRVNTTDIDEVQLGGTARVRLTAYSFRSTPPVTGRVVHVAPDSVISRETGQPYYRVDIAVDQTELAELPGVKTVAGMPAQAMIETGEQTVVEYLVNPIIGNLETAMREGQ